MARSPAKPASKTRAGRGADKPVAAKPAAKPGAGAARKPTKVGGGRQVDWCVDRLLAMIRSGELTPGQRLGEGMVSRMLGIGMAPVKMALDQLAYAGVIERRPRSGSYVAQWSYADYVQLMHMRASLEVGAAVLATRHGTDAELSTLVDKAQKLDDLIQKYLSEQAAPKAVYDAEVQFHMTVAQVSGNRWIRRALEDQRVIAECIRAWLDRPAQVVMAGTPGAEISHTLLAQAMRSRDAELAARAMRAHILAGVDPEEL